MKPHIIPEKGAFYWNELWFSEAYKTLPSKARDLLQCFLTELRKKHVSMGKRKEWAVINNGDISFTESSFRKLTGCSKETYRRSIHQLITRGLIELTYQGGSGQGDRSKYKILAIRELTKEQQKWRRFPQENWEKDIKRIANYSIGMKTKWVPGTSGRKLKTTLIGKAQKKQNSPNKKDTKKVKVPNEIYTNVCA